MLAFAAVASLPLLAVPIVMSQVSQSYDKTFSADLDDAGKLAASEIQALSTDVEARAHAVVNGSLLSDVQRAADGGDSASLLSLAAPALVTTGLDVLEIVDADGRILLCGQLPVRLGDRDATAQRLLGAPPTSPTLIHVDYRDGEEIRRQLALVVVLRPPQLSGGGLIAGRFFGDAELSRLAQMVRGDVTLQTVGGTVTAPSPGARSHRGFEQILSPSRRALDMPMASLEGGRQLHIELSDQALVQTKRRIVTGALLAFALALTVGVGLAAWLARRTVGPVQALVEGTRRVAQGDLSYRVEVRASGELASLVDAFNRMSSDLSTARDRLAHAERIAAWEQIARALAHEIKNPLTPIAMAIETLQRTHDRRHPEFDRFFREGTATVLEEVGRLKRLATEFGEFARWPKPLISPAAPSELVRGVAQLYGSLPPPHSLDTEAEPDLPSITVDRDQMQRALVNMVKNAIEAMPAGGHVTVRAQAADGGIVLEVADNGPGMSADTRARMFEPYFTTKAEGTGLGLAVVHRIVTEHEGRLSVDETPGGGTTFRIWLPRGGEGLRPAV
jgi:signal transduction histidine kinase